MIDSMITRQDQHPTGPGFDLSLDPHGEDRDYNRIIFRIALPFNASTFPLNPTIGIGRESAIALSKAGWNVVLTARRAGALHETSLLCESPAGTCIMLAGDITDEVFVKKLFSETIVQFGEPILVSTVLLSHLLCRQGRSSVQRKYYRLLELLLR